MNKEEVSITDGGSLSAELSNVFISYSSQDRDFVRLLDEEFKKQGREIWIDWKDAERTKEKEQEIRARIEAADNFIFVIGPEAMASEDRQKELAHAERHQKRIIPAAHSDLSGNLLPQALAGISPVYFRQGDDFARSFKSLINRIDADLKLDVFVSYSRKDEQFVQRLEEAFRTAERKVWIDRKSIQHTEEWLKAICSGIEAADNFVFIISPDSANSSNCRKELAHAVEHNKRLVPIIRRDVDSQFVPQDLAELDWVPFREADDFNGAFQTLLATVDTDLDYVRTHTRLLIRAIEWDKKGRDESLVLRGKDLLEAERWLVHAGNKKPKATAIQSQYLTTSRQKATRTQRIIRTAITAGLVLAISLALFATYQYRVAETERQEAKRRLAALYEEQGRRELLEGSPVKALAYLNEAYQEGSSEQSLKFLLAQAYRSLVGQTAAFNKHTEEIQVVAVSRDNRRIVSASDDHTAKIWDAMTGTVLFSLEGHADGLRSVSFSPDNKKVITASLDRTAKIWDATTGTLLSSLGHQAFVNSAEFSHSGKFVVTASADGTASVWNAESGHKLFPLTGHRVPPVFRALFSPDDKLIVTAGADNTAKVWDASDGKPLAALTDHTGWVNTVAFSPDSTQIATASYDNTAKVWNARTGQRLAVLHKGKGEYKHEGHDGPIVSISFSKDGTRILTSSWDRTAKIWAAKSGELITTLSGHSDKLTTAAFNDQNTRVVTASEDNTVKVWDAMSGLLLVSLDGHTERVNTAVFMPDDRYVVTAGLDARAIVWEWPTTAGTAPISWVAHDNTVTSASFSLDSRRVITASADGTAKVWDASNGVLLVTLDDGQKRYLTEASFSAGGQRILTVASHASDGQRILNFGEDSAVKIWDATTGKHLVSLDGYAAAVNSAAYDFDGRRIVTASADRSARVWDPSTGKQLVLLQGHTDEVNSAVFSSDGTRIVTASNDGTAKVWDAAAGKLLASLEGHAAPVFSASFNADSTRVVTASADKTAKLWDTATGKLLISLDGHAEAVTIASFSPNGSFVVTASQDNSAKLWNGKTGELVASLDAHLDDVKSASFDADGGRVVTAGDDNSVKVWDTNTGRLLISLQGHTKWVESAAFSPNNTQIVTAGGDRSVKIWDVHFENRSPQEMNDIVRRRVPFRVHSGRLLPSPLLSMLALPGHFE